MILGWFYKSRRSQPVSMWMWVSHCSPWGATIKLMLSSPHSAVKVLTKTFAMCMRMLHRFSAITLTKMKKNEDCLQRTAMQNGNEWLGACSCSWVHLFFFPVLLIKCRDYRISLRLSDLINVQKLFIALQRMEGEEKNDLFYIFSFSV